MILKLMCPAIACPYEPSIGLFAEMLGSGILPAQKIGPEGNWSKDYEEGSEYYVRMYRTKNSELSDEQKDRLEAIVEDAWRMYVKGLPDEASLSAGFSASVISVISESGPEDQAVYLCTCAYDDRKYIIM